MKNVKKSIVAEKEDLRTGIKPRKRSSKKEEVQESRIRKKRRGKKFKKRRMERGLGKFIEKEKLNKEKVI